MKKFKKYLELKKLALCWRVKPRISLELRMTLNLCYLFTRKKEKKIEKKKKKNLGE